MSSQRETPSFKNLRPVSEASSRVLSVTVHAPLLPAYRLVYFTAGGTRALRASAGRGVSSRLLHFLPLSVEILISATGYRQAPPLC